MSSIDDTVNGGQPQHMTMPGRSLNRSQERLLDGRRTPDYMEESCQLFGPFLTKALLQEKMKRSSMRTQSTQTDLNTAVEPAPPSYLSLSPRTMHKRLRSQEAQTQPRCRSHRPLTKSHSEVGDRPAAALRRRSPPPAELCRAVSSPITAPDSPPPSPPPPPLPPLPPSPPEQQNRSPSPQEIIIDYKPCERPFPLQKTLSEGEILAERRGREKTAAADVSLARLGAPRETVIEKLTVSESDLLEPGGGRLRALEHLQRTAAELPPPPPPRDYDDDEFHENLIENLLSEAVPHAEPTSSDSEVGDAGREPASPPRSTLTLTRDSLSESQETVLHVPGDMPLPLPSDSEAGTPAAPPPLPLLPPPEVESGSECDSLAGGGAATAENGAAAADNGARSSASGSVPSLAREEALVLRQLDAISTELDHRLASPEELSRLSPPPVPPPPPPPPLEGWKDASPAPSYVSSVSEGDEEKKLDKFMRTLNDGFESDINAAVDKRAKKSHATQPLGPRPVPSGSSSAESSQRWTITTPGGGAATGDAAADGIRPPSRVESLSSVSSIVGSEASWRREASDGSGVSDSAARRQTSVKRYSRYFEEDAAGQLVEVDGPCTLGSPSPETRLAAAERRAGGVSRRQLSKQFSVDEPERSSRSLSLQLSSSGRPRRRTEDVNGGKREALQEEANENAADDASSRTDHGKPDERWTKRGVGVTSGMVRSPAMHDGFRAADWSIVRTPQTPDKPRPGEDPVAEQNGAAETPRRREKKHKKRSKERTVNGAREDSTSRSRERSGGRRHTKHRSPKRRSTASEPCAPAPAADGAPPARPPASSSCDLRPDGSGGLTAESVRSVGRSVSPGSDSVFTADGSPDRGGGVQRVGRLNAVSSCTGERAQCASCGERLRTPEAGRSRSTSADGWTRSAAEQPAQENAEGAGDTPAAKRDGTNRTSETKPSTQTVEVNCAVVKQGESVVSEPSAAVDSVVDQKQNSVPATEGLAETSTAEHNASKRRKREKRRQAAASEQSLANSQPIITPEVAPLPAAEATSAASQDPAAASQDPAAAPQDPAAAPQDPTAAPQDPAAAPQDTPTAPQHVSQQPAQQPGSASTLPKDRQQSRGSSRRRRSNRSERGASEERVLEPLCRPVVDGPRARSEERCTTDDWRLQQPSPRTSQDSLSRAMDAATQCTIVARELPEEEAGLYTGHFPAARWLYIGKDEELRVWRRAPPPPTAAAEEDSGPTIHRSPSTESTESERDFRHRYQAISHRMVHRKSSGHMFTHCEQGTFDPGREPASLRCRLEATLRQAAVTCARLHQCLESRLGPLRRLAGDKTVAMQKCSGEFGFRIHGSRPVVVSAIEPGTPAQLSGLQVGDIIVSINGSRVLDSSHGDVVRIAHAAADELRLEVTSTSSVLPAPSDWSCRRQGWLWRRSCSAGGAWCRRWAVLQPDALLFLYRLPEDVHPVLGLSLADCAVTTSTDCGREMAFAVELTGSEPVTLAAETAEELDAWLETLRAAIEEAAAGRQAAAASGLVPAGTAIRCHQGTAPPAGRRAGLHWWPGGQWPALGRADHSPDEMERETRGTAEGKARSEPGLESAARSAEDRDHVTSTRANHSFLSACSPGDLSFASARSHGEDSFERPFRDTDGSGVLASQNETYQSCETTLGLNDQDSQPTVDESSKSGSEVVLNQVAPDHELESRDESKHEHPKHYEPDSELVRGQAEAGCEPTEHSSNSDFESPPGSSEQEPDAHNTECCHIMGKEGASEDLDHICDAAEYNGELESYRSEAASDPALRETEGRVHPAVEEDQALSESEPTEEGAEPAMEQGEEGYNPDEEVSEPAEDGSEPDEEGSEPAEQSEEPAEEGSEPDEEGSGPDEESSEPDKEGSDPGKEGSELAEEGSEPAAEGSEPVEASEPDEVGSEPVEEGSEPAKEGFEPTEESCEPIEEGSEPVEGFGPTQEAYEQVEEGSDPVEEGSEPVVEDSEPAEGVFGPTEEGSEPGEGSYEPVEECSEPDLEGSGLTDESSDGDCSEPAEEGFGRTEDGSEPVEVGFGPNEEGAVPDEMGSELAEEGFEPAEEGNGPVKESSEVTEDGFGPNEEGPEPAEDDSEPAEEDSEPAEEGSDPAENGFGPTEEDSEPVEEGSEPDQEGSEPVEKGSEPTEEGSEPVEEGCDTPEEGSEPAEEDFVPIQESSNPDEEDSWSADEGSNPDEEDSGPDEEESELDEEGSGPVEEGSESAEDGFEAGEEGSEPVEEGAEPAGEGSDPAGEDSEPVEEDSDPDEEGSGRVKEGSGPVERGSGPTDEVSESVEKVFQVTKEGREPVENDSEPAEDDSKPVEEVSEPDEQDSEPDEQGSEPAEYGFGPNEEGCEPGEEDSEPAEENFEPIEGGCEPIKGSESAEDDFEPTQEAYEPVEEGSDLVEEDPEPVVAGSEPAECNFVPNEGYSKFAEEGSDLAEQDSDPAEAGFGPNEEGSVLVEEGSEPAEKGFGPTEEDSEPDEVGYEPAEEGSKPNEEGFGPVKESSEVTEKDFGPAEEGSESAEGGSESAEEDSEPVEEGSDPAENGFRPTGKGSESAEEGSEPVEKGSGPTEHGSEPVEEGCDAAEEGSEKDEEGCEPSEEDFISNQESSKLDEEGSGPAEEGYNPVEEGSESDEEDFGPSEADCQPIEESSEPVEEGFGPAEEGPEPDEEGSEPVEEGSVPAEEGSESAEKGSESAEESNEPAEERSSEQAEDGFEPTEGRSIPAMNKEVSDAEEYEARWSAESEIGELAEEDSELAVSEAEDKFKLTTDEAGQDCEVALDIFQNHFKPSLEQAESSSEPALRQDEEDPEQVVDKGDELLFFATKAKEDTESLRDKEKLCFRPVETSSDLFLDPHSQSCSLKVGSGSGPSRDTGESYYVPLPDEANPDIKPGEPQAQPYSAAVINQVIFDSVPLLGQPEGSIFDEPSMAPSQENAALSSRPNPDRVSDSDLDCSPGSPLSAGTDWPADPLPLRSDRAGAGDRAGTSLPPSPPSPRLDTVTAGFEEEVLACVSRLFAELFPTLSGVAPPVDDSGQADVDADADTGCSSSGELWSARDAASPATDQQSFVTCCSTPAVGTDERMDGSPGSLDVTGTSQHQADSVECETPDTAAEHEHPDDQSSDESDGGHDSASLDLEEVLMARCALGGSSFHDEGTESDVIDSGVTRVSDVIDNSELPDAVRKEFGEQRPGMSRPRLSLLQELQAMSGECDPPGAASVAGGTVDGVDGAVCDGRDAGGAVRDGCEVDVALSVDGGRNGGGLTPSAGEMAEQVDTLGCNRDEASPEQSQPGADDSLEEKYDREASEKPMYDPADNHEGADQAESGIHHLEHLEKPQGICLVTHSTCEETSDHPNCISSTSVESTPDRSPVTAPPDPALISSELSSSEPGITERPVTPSDPASDESEPSDLELRSESGTGELAGRRASVVRGDRSGRQVSREAARRRSRSQQPVQCAQS